MAKPAERLYNLLILRKKRGAYYERAGFTYFAQRL